MSNSHGLKPDTTDRLLNIIGKRESSDNYQAENQLGYTGRYQFGAAALADVGAVNRERYDAWRSGGSAGGQKTFLNDPSNWRIPGGKTAWMQNPELQDEAAAKLLSLNAKRLTDAGVFREGMSERERAGFLMAAHLGGAGNAAKLAQSGEDFRDANDTSIKEYFELGATAAPEGPVVKVSADQRPVPPGLARALEQERNDFGQLVEDAFVTDNTIGGFDRISRGLSRAFGGGFDPAFTGLTAEQMEEMAKEQEIPVEVQPDFFEYLTKARSEEDIPVLVDQWNDLNERMARASEHGLPAQFGATALAVLADPAILAGGWVAGASKLGRLITSAKSTKAAAFRGALYGAGANAAQEALVNVDNPTRGEVDLLLAAAFGAPFGAAGGAIGRALSNRGAKMQAEYNRAMDGAQERFKFIDKPEAGKTGAPLESSMLLNTNGRPLKQYAKEELNVDVDNVGDDLGDELPAGGQDSAGAARASDEDREPGFTVDTGADILEKAELYVGHTNEKGRPAIVPKPQSRLGKARIDSLFPLIRSRSSRIRALGYALFPEHIETTVAQKMTAGERQKWLDAKMRVGWKKTMLPEFKKYMQEAGSPMWRYHMGAANNEWEKFHAEVADYVRTGNTNVSDSARKAGDDLRPRIAEYLKLGQEAGVFDSKIDINPNYLPRVFDSYKVQNFITKYSEEVMDALIAKAIRVNLEKKVGKVDEKVLATVAKAYSTSIKRRTHDFDPATMFGLTMEDVDLLDSWLLANGIDDAAQRGLVTQSMQRRNEQLSKIGQAKHRMDLDEGTTLSVKEQEDLGLSGWGVVSIQDLLENNADVLFTQYSRRVSGAVALKERLGIVGTEAEISRLLDGMRSELVKARASDREIRRELRTAEALVRRIAGKPLFDGEFDPGNYLVRTTNAIRKFNFAVYMVNAGIASFAEMGNLVGKMGMTALTQGIPAFRQLVRSARTGEIDDEFVQFVEEYMGIGADDMLHSHFNRYDDVSTDFMDERQLTGTERFLNSAQHFVAEKVSMLGPMTRLQKRFAVMANMWEVERWAFADKALSPAWKRRMAQAGLKESDLGVIKAMMQKHGVQMKSDLRNRSFTRADMNAWRKEDPKSFNQFMTAIGREADRVIIEGDVTAMPVIAQGLIGRILLQFQTFAINAHTKLLLRGMALHDAQVAGQFLASGMFATMAYIAQMNVLAAGDEEKRDFLLSPDKVAKAFFARAGHAALLPALSDRGLTAFGFDPFFDMRVSGAPSDFITGTPTINTINSATGVLGMAAQLPRDDYDFSKSNVRDIQNLTFLSKQVGVAAAINLLAEDLPQESR